MLAYNIALFVHILGAVGIVGGSTLEHVLRAREVRARTSEQLGEVLGLSELLSRAMPIFAVLVLAAGLYMTIARWGFQFAWLDVSLALLVGIGAAAPIVLDPAIKAARRDISAGEPVERARAILSARAYVTTGNVFTAEAIAIVALMTIKPDWVPSLVIVVAAALIGVALGMRSTGPATPARAAEQVVSARQR